MERSSPEKVQLRCNYLGTEIDHKWWKRYRGEGFFMRGNGHCWLEGDAVCISRIMLKGVIRIPVVSISDVSVGKWHGGTWFAGRPVIKIDWSNELQNVLTTGIGVRDPETARDFIDDLNSRTSENSAR